MMLTVLGFLFTGFILGLQHSLDADHIAAVSSIVSKHKSIKKSTLIGAAWGIGHTTTLLLIGIVVIVLRISIPERISQFFEFVVGLMLLYLGAALLKTIFVDKVHLHRHDHDGVSHLHLHSHKHSSRHDHLHKPFLVGIVHGMAGSAGIMLLILATMNSVTEGLLFTLTFGIGSILGMMATGAAIGIPFLLAGNNTRYLQVFMFCVAFITIGVGVSVVAENWVF